MRIQTCLERVNEIGHFNLDRRHPGYLKRSRVPLRESWALSHDTARVSGFLREHSLPWFLLCFVYFRHSMTASPLAIIKVDEVKFKGNKIEKSTVVIFLSLIDMKCQKRMKSGALCIRLSRTSRHMGLLLVSVWLTDPILQLPTQTWGDFLSIVTTLSDVQKSNEQSQTLEEFKFAAKWKETITRIHTNPLQTFCCRPEGHPDIFTQNLGGSRFAAFHASWCEGWIRLWMKFHQYNKWWFSMTPNKIATQTTRHNSTGCVDVWRHRGPLHGNLSESGRFFSPSSLPKLILAKYDFLARKILFS